MGKQSVPYRIEALFFTPGDHNPEIIVNLEPLEVL
jgi:hypothetical protein